MRGAECSIVEARARKPMSLGLLGLHQGSEHRFRSRVAATFRMLFREVASRHPSALLLAFCPDLDRACPETGDGGRRGAVLGVRGGLFWQWACGASPVLVTGVTLREPRMDIWQWSQVFAEKTGRVGCAWLRCSSAGLAVAPFASWLTYRGLECTRCRRRPQRRPRSGSRTPRTSRRTSRGPGPEGLVVGRGRARRAVRYWTAVCGAPERSVGRGAVVVCRDRVHGAH